MFLNGFLSSDSNPHPPPPHQKKQLMRIYFKHMGSFPCEKTTPADPQFIFYYSPFCPHFIPHLHIFIVKQNRSRPFIFIPVSQSQNSNLPPPWCVRIFTSNHSLRLTWWNWGLRNYLRGNTRNCCNSQKWKRKHSKRVVYRRWRLSSATSRIG